jgi:hypothetical protein
MKKIFLLFIISMFVMVGGVCADRNTATTTTYNSSQLIKTGNGLLYSVSFVATSNGGNYILYDGIATTQGFGDIKSEGSEATSANGSFKDYSNKPLKFSTGLYLSVTNGYVIVSYE